MTVEDVESLDDDPTGGCFAILIIGIVAIVLVSFIVVHWVIS